MDKDIKIEFAKINEQFAKIDNRFAKIDEQFTKIDNRFAQIDERFTKINERFSSIDKTLELLAVRMNQGFVAIDKRFERIDQRFEQIDKRFEAVDKRFEQMDEKFLKLDQAFHSGFDELTDAVGFYSTKIESKFVQIEQTMVSKDYLDRKLANLKLEIAGKPPKYGSSLDVTAFGNPLIREGELSHIFTDLKKKWNKRWSEYKQETDKNKKTNNK